MTITYNVEQLEHDDGTDLGQFSQSRQVAPA